MIEHDIEDDLEARAVKRLDHVAKFVEGREPVLLRAVRLMWREERNGGIAPVVRLARRAVLRVELEHRQQLHRGDAEILEVWYLFDQSPVRPALVDRDTRAGMACEAPHMQLVNHGLGKGPLERPIAFPIVPVGIGHDAFHRHRDIVAGPRRSPAVVCPGDGYDKPVRVEKHLLGVEPKSTARIESPVRAVGIHLARLEARHEGVPVVIGAMLIRIERDDPCGLRSIFVVEQQQLQQDRVLGEHAEIDTVRQDRRAERSARTRCDIAAAAYGPHPAHRSSKTIGVTFQMSRQYSRIERSDEKRPTRAQLRIDIRVQALRSPYAWLTRCLAVYVGLVVRQEHVVVAGEQRIDERLEQSRDPRSKRIRNSMRSIASRSSGFDS